MLIQSFREYCSETTVHGFRFFVERNRHWIERFWWAISFILSVALCTFAILNIWSQWQDKPVLVTFNDKTTSADTIPFPAVTICSSQKISNLSEPNQDKVDEIRHLIEIIEDMKLEKNPNLSSEL